MIRVLIADDHPVVRKGLRQILEDTQDIIAADEASSAQEVLNKVSKRSYDVILLDISMPGSSGLDVLKQLKRKKSKLPVLMLSIYPEDQYGMRALRAGASGYLTKESLPDELVGAIRKVAQGRKYISPALSEKLVLDLGINSDKPAHETLSDREYQVMCMIASGKTASGIAKKLCLSVKTISTYRSRILEKMRMKNNAEITRYAIENRLTR
ncbi:response regulator [Elusimicrobiota bacterium]